MQYQGASDLTNSWTFGRRWQGIERTYSADDVFRLRGSIHVEHTLARMGAERFWRLLDTELYIKALGALTGNQAVQQVQAGLQAVYVSGWQVAADANDARSMYPDQSLYPARSVPDLVRAINNALLRADQIQHMEAKENIHWFVPIIADGEAGFGGPLNTFELMKAMIESGAAAVHLEDQLASAKKCGHMGGKVLVSLREFVTKLLAARLAADILDVPTVLIGRTDASGAKLVQSDVDPLDQLFLNGTRTQEGFYTIKGGLEYAAARAIAFAPYCDIVWCETSSPDLGEAREFAQAIHGRFPKKTLAYNCSPSFNWKRNLDEPTIARFQEELALMGYKFQFVTLAGFHTLNASMFELARAYQSLGMTAYAQFQQREFELELQQGFKAVKHQRFVGTNYFDEIQLVVSGGESSTTALKESTETLQFF